MKWKEKLWKYATLFVVIVIILNPEMVELALLIDAVGLEMFIMLLEVQVLTLLGAILNSKIKPIIEFIKSFYASYFPPFTWQNIKKRSEYWVFATQSPAILMNLLVFSAATGLALNVYK